MLDRFAVGSWTVRLRSLRDHSLRSLRINESLRRFAPVSQPAGRSLFSQPSGGLLLMFFLTQNELPYRATRYML